MRDNVPYLWQLDLFQQLLSRFDPTALGSFQLRLELQHQPQPHRVVDAQAHQGSGGFVPTDDQATLGSSFSSATGYGSSIARPRMPSERTNSPDSRIARATGQGG
jgi:hypothetical protein